MPSTKDEFLNAKEKRKLSKLIEDSDSDQSEHELSHYVNDRVKLMKEVLKTLKLKKIKSMTPECMRNMDIEEINSILLEELLGISNKRLKYIFTGQNLDEDSSSTDDDEKKPIDIISLDDVSEDDFIIDLDADENQSSRSPRKKKKIKKEHKDKELKEKKIKKEKSKSKDKKNLVSNENLMSVLELLELQARARAIKSQLTLEKGKEIELVEIDQPEPEISDNDDDEVVIEVPKQDEIVITSSESEPEDNEIKSQNTSNDKGTSSVNNSDLKNVNQTSEQPQTEDIQITSLQTEEQTELLTELKTKNGNACPQTDDQIEVNEIPLPKTTENKSKKIKLLRTVLINPNNEMKDACEESKERTNIPEKSSSENENLNSITPSQIESDSNSTDNKNKTNDEHKKKKEKSETENKGDFLDNPASQEEIVIINLDDDEAEGME